MRSLRLMRAIKGLASGAILLQAGGCDLVGLNELLQTVFSGITAAASLEILNSGSFNFF